MSEEIKVSVITLAYNQKEYIAQALKTCINQKTDFKYEIVVHDDCSTDGTTDIIREYERKYPDIVHAYYEQKNQYSQGINVFDLCIGLAKGKYVAICEGDDYWTDKEKLQMQYDIMESHPEIDMCAAGAAELSSDIITQEIRPKKEDAVLSLSEVILGGGRYIATATLFFRKEILLPQNLLPFEKIISFDYANQIKGALRGGIYYKDKQVAVYRRATENSWTMRVEQNQAKRKKHLDLEMMMLRQFDFDTNGEYHEYVEQRLQAYVPFVEQLMVHKEEIDGELKQTVGDLYLWGMGLRGNAIEEFCAQNDISLMGVCDKKNSQIGAKTIYQNSIISTEEVLQNSKVIIASNDLIADAIEQLGYKGEIIRMQKYMRLS